MSSSKRLSTEYSFEPQTKKQFGDETAEYKKLVYDKTIQKLYDGAKRNTTSQSILEVTTPMKNLKLNTETKRGLKQVALSNTCQLENQIKVTNPKEYCPVLPEMCSFCERLGCFTSLYQCTKCKYHFCSNCSFKKISGSEEKTFCKTCY